MISKRKSNFIVLCVFGLGILIGIVLISKLFEYLFKRQETKTYFGVLGFIYASIIAIPYSALHNLKLSFSIFEVILSVVLVVAGIFIAYYLGDKKD